MSLTIDNDNTIVAVKPITFQLTIKTIYDYYYTSDKLSRKIINRDIGNSDEDLINYIITHLMKRKPKYYISSDIKESEFDKIEINNFKYYGIFQKIKNNNNFITLLSNIQTFDRKKSMLYYIFVKSLNYMIIDTMEIYPQITPESLENQNLRELCIFGTKYIRNINKIFKFDFDINCRNKQSYIITHALSYTVKEFDITDCDIIDWLIDLLDLDILKTEILNRIIMLCDAEQDIDYEFLLHIIKKYHCNDDIMITRESWSIIAKCLSFDDLSNILNYFTTVRHLYSQQTKIHYATLVRDTIKKYE